MADKQLQMFGGGWTEKKINVLREYNCAFTTALKNTSFRLVYIDAFAGTGYRRPSEDLSDSPNLFADLIEEEPQGFLAGSVQIALDTEPPFHRFVFVEKDPAKFEELEATIGASGRADSVELYHGDANGVILDICRTWDWREHRAVLFLDPFGMQVEWETIEAIAETQAIDTWILFPISAVNRLLKRDGRLPEEWQEKLTRVFGTDEWRDRFYREDDPSLIDHSSGMEKTCSFDGIAEFWKERLRTIFVEVADNPIMLCNGSGTPLYLLCFAASNENGASIAIRIAKHILNNADMG